MEVFYIPARDVIPDGLAFATARSWLNERRDQNPLIAVGGEDAFNRAPELLTLVRQRWLARATYRTLLQSDWGHGAALVPWPSLQLLAEIERREPTAVLVILSANAAPLGWLGTHAAIDLSGST